MERCVFQEPQLHLLFEAVWFKLHQQELFPYAFDPIKSNFESLNKAKAKCRNPFLKEIYCSLIDCRLNILLDYPDEYKYIPINGEPFITGNSIPVRQEWALYKCLNSIFDHKGNLRRVNEINSSKKTFEYEYNELKVSLRDFLETYLGGRLGANRSKVTTNCSEREAYNIYGQMPPKRKKSSPFSTPCLIHMLKEMDGLIVALS